MITPKPTITRIPRDIQQPGWSREPVTARRDPTEMSYPPEFNLLLEIARRWVTPNADYPPLLSAGIILNWDLVFQYAEKRQFTPLLAAGLKRECWDVIPADVKLRLDSFSRGIRSKNIFVARELAMLLGLFARKGIPAAPYKGPLLAERLYGDLALRQSTDLDILVPLNRLFDAVQAMREVGYTERHTLTPQDVELMLKREYNYKMMRDGYDKIWVELHWAFGQQGRAPTVDIETVWRRMTPVKFPPVETLMMHADDQLLLAAIHLAYHAAAGTMKLKWLVDIALMINKPPAIGWDDLLKMAKQIGALRMLLTSLAITRDVTGVALPDTMILQLKKDPIAEQMALVLQQINFPDKNYSPSFENNLLYLKMRERWRDKFAFILFYLRPTKADTAVLPLPRSLSFLYWCFRPFRLVRNYSGKVVSAWYVTGSGRK